MNIVYKSNKRIDEDITEGTVKFAQVIVRTEDSTYIFAPQPFRMVIHDPDYQLPKTLDKVPEIDLRTIEGDHDAEIRDINTRYGTIKTGIEDVPAFVFELEELGAKRVRG